MKRSEATYPLILLALGGHDGPVPARTIELHHGNAHDLYARVGYEQVTEPDRWMFRRGPA